MLLSFFKNDRHLYFGIYQLTQLFHMIVSLQAVAGNAFRVTEPICMCENDTPCQHPVFQEETLKYYLNHRVVTLWTDVERQKLDTQMWIDESGSGNLQKAQEPNLKCSFLEVKGYRDPELGVNLCSQKYGFICMKQDCDDCAKACYNSGQACFHIHCPLSSSDWASAVQQCRHLGGNLAVIRSRDLMSQVGNAAFELCQKIIRKFWVGKTNFRWVYRKDAAPVPYGKWLPGEPSLTGDFAVLSRSAEGTVALATKPCGSRHRLLCENRLRTEEKLRERNETSKRSNEPGYSSSQKSTANQGTYKTDSRYLIILSLLSLHLQRGSVCKSK